ncbi:MAG: mannonate dehydratase [Rhodopirellula sp. JB044]|uniref:mannonate dehydratase n=1 Tax=Rhodopirellula sp. JB044 TaxID=3342844 RepID=UPI00370BC62D
MNLDAPGLGLMEEGLRWFGPNDPVPLPYLRQAGATAVFSSLHQIPYGEVWSRDAIGERRRLIEAAGLKWSVVESVPVHERIKVGRGELKPLFRNYADTLRHLADEGIRTVIYNFMPVLDWVRTEMNSLLPDGSRCLHYDPVRFAAFEVYALRRRNAESDYTDEQLAGAKIWWEGLDYSAQEAFVQTVIDVFPGVQWGLTLDHIRDMLAKYDGIDSAVLRANLKRFLEEIVPVAEEVGVRLAIHPDDPPFSVLGLPRITSTAEDIDAILSMVDSPSNGLCFCTGSFSAREDNDVSAMAMRFASRIHAVHLRSTQRLEDGSFYEADHLRGSVDMPSVVRVLLDEQDRRHASGQNNWQLPMRPDHGHTMMDDLLKPVGITPGYTCIGRTRGLAELRGLMLGLRYAERISCRS